MRMSYTKNPNLPKLRADAVKLVCSGKGVREVARYLATHLEQLVNGAKK